MGKYKGMAPGSRIAALKVLDRFGNGNKEDVLQAFVLFCCLAAGNDPGSQEISDQEQMEYIQMWMKDKKRKA